MLSQKKLKYLILLNLTWSILGVIADFPWLSSIPSYLIPLTAICSLYPPLLTIWYILKYLKKEPPNFLTLWIVIGTISYGILAQIYFPLLMSWKGINFHDVGSMFWVAVYGLQSLIILPYLKRLRLLEVFLVIGYFIAADYTHFFVPTFVDFIMFNYPLWLKNSIGIMTLFFQSQALVIAILSSYRQALRNVIKVDGIPATIVQ